MVTVCPYNQVVACTTGDSKGELVYGKVECCSALQVMGHMHKSRRARTSAVSKAEPNSPTRTGKRTAVPLAAT